MTRALAAPLSTGGPIEDLVKAVAVHLEACTANGCSPATITQYEGRYRQYLTFLKTQGYEPPFALELLDPALVRRAVIWLRERSHDRRGGQGGAHAARVLVSTLKTGSAWLADEGYLAYDPLSRMKRPKAPSAARLPLTQEEVRKLIGAATETQTGARDAAIILLMLDTGMRVGSVCSIQRSELDLKERRVVLRLKGGREHVLYFGTSERRDGGRTVRALRRYVDERDALVHRWADTRRGDKSAGHLFLSFDGWPLTERGFHNALASLGRAANVEGVHPHKLRHTFATHFLIRNPGDETGLRGILGHLSADMYRTYTHIAHEIIAQRAGRVALSEAWLGSESEREAS